MKEICRSRTIEVHILFILRNWFVLIIANLWSYTVWKICKMSKKSEKKIGVTFRPWFLVLKGELESNSRFQRRKQSNSPLSRPSKSNIPGNPVRLLAACSTARRNRAERSRERAVLRSLARQERRPRHGRPAKLNLSPKKLLGTGSTVLLVNPVPIQNHRESSRIKSNDLPEGFSVPPSHRRRVESPLPRLQIPSAINPERTETQPGNVTANVDPDLENLTRRADFLSPRFSRKV